jgi:hypothetical protein
MNVKDSSLLLAISVVKLLEYTAALCRQLYDYETHCCIDLVAQTSNEQFHTKYLY